MNNFSENKNLTQEEMILSRAMASYMASAIGDSLGA